jgi:catecholate siderophore receptor
MSENNSTQLACQENNRPSIASRLFTTTAVIGTAFVPTIAKAQESKQLPTVTVVDSQENNSYKATESSNPKLTGPLLDNPRSVTTVTRQLMDDQGVTRLSDALRNVPGISIAAGEGGNQGDNFTIRGFAGRTDQFIDGMRDFGSYYRDTFNIESLEVIQGPSSVLFGRGSTGGVVAQNSKQAFLGSKKEGSLMVGTNQTSRATVDVNSEIKGIEGAAIRLNAMAHSNEVAQRDEASFKRHGFAPSLAFGLGTETRLNINFFHQEEDNIPDYGIPFYAGKPAEVDRSNYYGNSNDFLKSNTDISTVKFEHDFSDDLSIRNQTRYARYQRDVQISNPSSSNGITATRSMIIRKSLETYLGNQTDLTSKFSTFGIEHTLVTGLALETETSSPNNFSGSAGALNLANPLLATYTGGANFNGVTKTKIDTFGIYALDTMKFNKKWEMALGLRRDSLRTTSEALSSSLVNTIRSRNDDVVSYSAGLVYKPKPNGSIYFNHGTSFNPSAESISLSDTNVSLEPEKNTSYEIGTKWDLFKKRLTANAAVFRLDKDNARETVDGFGVLSGHHTSRGILLQLSGKITEKWNLMMGYTFMDAKVKKSLVNDFYKNRALTNAPEHMFNLFTTYKFDSQLEIGGGLNFVSERFTSPTSAPDAVSGTTRNIPSYVVFNAMAKYPVSKNLELQLNINNITNEFYYDQLRGSNAAIPGEGRVVLLSTNFKF